jgi:hypothetical protein
VLSTDVIGHLPKYWSIRVEVVSTVNPVSGCTLLTLMMIDPKKKKSQTVGGTRVLKRRALVWISRVHDAVIQEGGKGTSGLRQMCISLRCN